MHRKHVAAMRPHNSGIQGGFQASLGPRRSGIRHCGFSLGYLASKQRPIPQNCSLSSHSTEYDSRLKQCSQRQDCVGLLFHELETRDLQLGVYESALRNCQGVQWMIWVDFGVKNALLADAAADTDSLHCLIYPNSPLCNCI